MVVRASVGSRLSGRAVQRFLLDGISWQGYVAIAEGLNERPVRLTYDRGRLELMTLSRAHEIYSELLALFVRLLLLELDLSHKSGGSMTFQREDLERGLEPDNCFWIKQYEAVLGTRALDLTRDPPPDLVLEIDVTRSSLDRMGTYAVLGVPEVWRFDGRHLSVYRLRRKKYVLVTHSPTFPKLPLDQVARLVRQCESLDDLQIHKSFTTWIRAWHSRQTNGA